MTTKMIEVFRKSDYDTIEEARKDGATYTASISADVSAIDIFTLLTVADKCIGTDSDLAFQEVK